MADDKSKRDQRDRSRVVARQDCEVQHFAERHGMTAGQARDLIRRFGNDRDRLEKEAARIA